MMKNPFKRKSGKFSIPALILFAVCIFGQSSEAQTSIYIFDPNQSTVVQTGGFAGVHETYPVNGLFQLTVDANIGVASFDYVEAFLLSPVNSAEPEHLGELFNMTELTGTVLSDTTLEFTGFTADGSSILLDMTIADDIVTMKAQTTPPPNSADFFIFSMDAVANRKYAGGTGEPNNPYLIYTAEQMNTIGIEPNDWDKHFKLMADIDLSAYTGTEFNIIGYYIDYYNNKPFTGLFEGSGHTISNFTYTSTNKDNIGLFGRVENGVIKDLVLIAACVNAGTGNNVGSLVGWIHGGTISSCLLQDVTVSGGENVGGLMGHSHRYWMSEYKDCKTFNCYVITNVVGLERVGGLVGRNEGATISSCYSTGSVSGVGIIGGLVGQNGYWYSGREGGLYVDGFINDCYSNCDVTGSTKVGGLVGFNSVGEITRCYSSGAVLDSEPNRPIDSNDGLIGGLVGDNNASTTDCFWDVETSGLDVSAAGMGKTTEEMQTAVAFITWGACGSFWTINEGQDYPRLTWENMPGEFITGPAYGGGTGTAEDPYLIYSADHLNMIGLTLCDWDKHFKLMTDIDLSEFSYDKALIAWYGWEEIPFTGVFDGNSHTISNLTISGESLLGLFGRLESGAEVRDLRLVDVNVMGSDSIIGALVGYNKGNLIRCYSSGTVNGSRDVGGLAGESGGTINQCHSSCMVTGWGWIGGIVGANNNSLKHCYSAGSVTGYSNVGGLVGNNSGGVTFCYSTSEVNGSSSSSVGGLVGSSGSASKVIYCFWDIETSGQTTSDGGVGKTTAEMKTKSTFTSRRWDFDDIWWIDEGQDYPRLWWEAMEE